MRAYRQIGICSQTSSMRKLRVSMTISHGLVPSPFATRPHLNGDSSLAQIERENGPTSLEGPVLHLSTAKPAEGPDERQILTSQLTTPTAADYLSLAPLLSLSVNQTANRLGTFLTNWNLLTTDKWILQAVSGYKIPFLRAPHQWRARPTVVQEGQPTELMKEAIQSLIFKGAISVVNPCPQQFISTLFLMEKGQGTGEFRPVINLKALNRFLPKEKFKMEGLHTARSLLRKGDYMMKLDLRDAYYAVPIHPESRKYLCFQFKGTTYEFRCLPFGLSLAPRVFTRILRPIVAKLRSEGIRTVIYLDDLLLIHHQKDTLSEIFLYVRRLLSSLGFLVKLEKRSPEPTHRLVFLGAVLDTTYMSVALPEEQINRIQGACQEMLESRSTSPGGLSSLLGRMSHAARTGLWIAPLYYRALQCQQALQLHQFRWRPRCQMLLSRLSLEDLRWWVSPTLHEHNSQDITPPPFDFTIRTDASLLGWGATCNGTSTGGRWSVEAEQHINCLELKAAILALKAFLRVGMQPSPRSLGHHPPRHILLEMDNTTAVAYVSRRGGSQSPSLSLLALELWSFLLTQGSWVTARHLPGVKQTQPRGFSTCAQSGCFGRMSFRTAHHFHLPEIDLFASRLNHQLSLYVSRLPDPSAAAVDAFQQDWSKWKSFIHPPVVLLSRILQKVRSDKATALLVAPDWPGQPWYAQIQLMLTGAPYPLPKEKSLLTLPFDQEAIHPLWQSDCMADIGSAYQAAGFPEEVTNVLLASWPQSTKKRYQGPWRAWSNWCSSRGLCPFSAPVTDVLPFLTETVTNQSLEYRTLAVYKSAISQGHLPVGQTKLGDLPVVSCFMKGIFSHEASNPSVELNVKC